MAIVSALIRTASSIKLKTLLAPQVVLTERRRDGNTVFRF